MISRSKFLRYARRWTRARCDDEHGRRYWSDLVPSYVKTREDLTHAVGDVPRLKVRCGAPDSRSLECDELVCFERDWQWRDRQSANNCEDDKQAHNKTEPATKKRKLKANKEQDLNSFLDGL